MNNKLNITGLTGFIILISFFYVCSSEEKNKDKYTIVVQEGRFKYVAAITSRAGVCTGTIINTEWILTAAHCLYYDHNPIRDQDAVIYVGVVNYLHRRADTKQETKSKKIVIHPKFWEGKPAKWDIALVQVADRMVFNDYVGAMEIANMSWPVDEQMNCTVLGFGGYKSTLPETNDLKAWNVTAEHDDDKACYCARRYQKKRLICVQESPPLLCQGDDGGPLVCDNKVFGIGHMVWNDHPCENPIYPLKKCAGGPEKGYSVFFFLCPALDWLHDQLKDIPEKPESCIATRVLRPSYLTIFTVYSLPLLILLY